jgi:hypothetical protein
MVGSTPQRPLSCGIHALQGCLLVALRQGSAHEVVAVAARMRFTLLDTFHFPSSGRQSRNHTRWFLTLSSFLPVAARHGVALDGLFTPQWPLSYGIHALQG